MELLLPLCRFSMPCERAYAYTDGMAIGSVYTVTNSEKGMSPVACAVLPHSHLFVLNYAMSANHKMANMVWVA